MDRWHASWSFLAALGRRAPSAGVALGALAAVACAESGPAIVEHPRSSPMVAASPESDPLAGAVTFPSSGGDVAAPDPAPALALETPPQLGALGSTHVSLRGGEWSLALGTGETTTTVAPPIALSAALSMSAGPAPHLTRAAPGVVAVSVSDAAVEEGAWEARRR